MAPEILSGVDYSGAAVDLFAASVILYIMMVGRPCFHTAKASDPYYKYMAAGKCEKFWAKHVKTFEGGEDQFSPEWLDMMNSMLQYEPSARLSIEELKAHPWYSGDVPTDAQISEEFARRWEMLSGASPGGESPDEVDGAVFTDDAHVHRGEGDPEDVSSLPAVERKCKDHVKTRSLTTFFSNSGEERLFNAVAAFAEGMEALSFKFARETYKATLTMVEEDEEEPEIRNTVDFQIQIKKVAEKGKWAVEFKKVSGDIMVFNRIYKDAKEFFGALVNEGAE